MITKEFQDQYCDIPNNITTVQKLVLKALRENKYSLSETRYLFDSILEKIEKTAIIDNFK